MSIALGSVLGSAVNSTTFYTFWADGGKLRKSPLAIDLFCGLGGWTKGLLAEGYYVIGFDIECHIYGEHHYPAQLVLQDILTLHGSQLKDASLIVASPPCQEFSYMAMPWSLAKKKERRIETDPAERKRLTALFDACFRIQREACEAAGRHIPMVVENVRGAQKWVGQARWHFGSFYLWGDVPALMPMTSKRRMKYPVPCGPKMWKDREVPRLNDGDSSLAHRGEAYKTSSKSKARKAASAMIAMIPFVLARHIGRVLKFTRCDEIFDCENPNVGENTGT